jgi:hypothetical protein
MNLQLVGKRALVTGASAGIPRCNRKGAEGYPEVQRWAAALQGAGPSDRLRNQRRQHNDRPTPKDCRPYR